MNDLDIFYDECEFDKCRFIGFVTENHRYDFAFVYTDMFYGKLIIICLQTNSSTLLDRNDLQNPEQLQQAFKITSLDEAVQVSLFLLDIMPSETHYMLYD